MDNYLECYYSNTYLPKIAVNGDSLYVCWRAIDKDTIPKVFFCSSYNNGASFHKPIVLVDSTSSHYNDIVGNSLMVAAKAGQVYVSYNDEDDQAYLLKSGNGGVSFTKPVMMFNDGRVYIYYQNGTLSPRVAFAPSAPTGNKVYFMINNPKYRYSENGFSTLPPLKIIDLYYTGGYRERTQLAVDRHDVAHFVYEYCASTSTEEPRYIYYRPVHLSVKQNESVNMSLSMECNEDIGRYDCMYVSSSKDFVFNDAMTIECWIKRKAGSDPDQNYLFKQCMDEEGLGSFSNGYGLFSDENVPSAMIYTSEGKYQCYNYDYTLLDDEWTHLAVTFDPGASDYNFKLYINGEAIDSTKALGKISPYQFESPLWVGGIARSQNAPFNGEIDELRYWNKALSKEAIMQNLRQELSGKENGLVAYYNFNNTTRDIIGRGNDGTLLYKEQFVENNLLDFTDLSESSLNYLLLYNYPKPFSSSLRIRYYLAEQSQVTLMIFDIVSREVL